MRKDLDHEDADQFFLRINPESRSCCTAPIVFTRRAHHSCFTGSFADREPESESSTEPHPREGPQVVAAHQLNSLPAEKPLSVVLPVVQHHLAESQVVIRRRRQASTTRLHT